MTSTRPVPQSFTSATALSSPIGLMRREGVCSILRDAFLRLRYGDGFSHARAVGLLLCLAVVPFLIALTGLADEVGVDEGGEVIAYTTLALTPGRSDALVRRLLMHNSQGDTGEVALVVGLISGLAALTAAMAQIERGANRLYGVRRDRPTVAKYGRALVLTTLAGIPAFLGFLLMVAGRALATSLDRAYRWGWAAEQVWTIGHLPVALVLTVTAVGALFRWAPRRRQPSFAWLLPGVLLSTALWVAVTTALALYATSGLFFSEIYGPLAGVVALLLWANISAVALFFGVACCAQLEACRAGDPQPCEPDQWA